MLAKTMHNYYLLTTYGIDVKNGLSVQCIFAAVANVHCTVQSKKGLHYYWHCVNESLTKSMLALHVNVQ